MLATGTLAAEVATAINSWFLHANLVLHDEEQELYVITDKQSAIHVIIF